MTRVNEFTPLLVNDGDPPLPFPGSRRSNVWQFVLAGALSLGVLSFFQQQQRSLAPVDIEDVAVSFDADDEAAFLSTMETFKDPSVDPCVDFYQYACGGWLKTHEIPSDRPGIDSSFYVVSEANKDTIKKIFDQNPPQIGQLYHSCLNDQEVDANATAFVSQLIESVHQTNSTIALLELAGELDQSLGISSFFSVFVGADPEDPTTNVLQLAQGGLTLPSKEYYLEQTKVDAFAALYVNYVTALFAVGDLDKHNVSDFAYAVLETETKFAKISLPNAALRDPWTTNTAYPFAEIAQRYPFVMAYLNGVYKQQPFPMLHAIIATPTFFEAQNELLSDESMLPELKNYLSFHLIDSFGTILGEYFRRVSHDFHGKIQGAGVLLPRDQFCVRLTTSLLGDEVGKYYMQDVFGSDAKAAAQALVTEIEESLKALLLTESWLDKVTYDAAVEKLNKVKNYIGGPDEVPPLPFELQGDAFFDNVKSLMQLSAAGTIQSIGKPVDEQAWDMFPSTVNAYYDPSANKMVFPAAILQPPFYSADHFPAAANFARIGMVMGHELSHGFDDQGRNYDGDGALRSWWTPSVSAEFTEKAQCLAAQYSTFPVVSNQDGHVLGTVNGNLTLGENIADNGGIHLAYEAYQLWKSTFAPQPIVPPETTFPPTEPVKTVPVPEPVKPTPAPEPTEAPIPTEVPSPDEPSPNDEIPAATPAPVLPIPEVPTPTNPNDGIPAATPAPVVPVPEAPVPEPTEPTEPTDTGPGEEIPKVTLPPPVVPVPEAETPEPVPQPGDVGPGELIPKETEHAPTPEDQTPPPTDTEPPTAAPVVTSPPPPPTVSTPPDVPDTSIPPVVPQPEPSSVSPDKSPGHKHKKVNDEPSAEPDDQKHAEKKKHHEGEVDKSKSDKDDDKSRSGHTHDHDKHGGEDEKDRSKKAGSEKQDKSSDDGKKKGHNRHKGDSASKDEGLKKPTQHSDKSGERDESDRDQEKKKHGKEDKDSDRDESAGKKHHENREKEGDRDRHEHKSSHRREEERNEEEGKDRHGGKHHGHEKHADREKEDRHGKHSYYWDEDEGDSERHRHHKHESKHERREERKEAKKENEEGDRKHHHHWEDYDDDDYDGNREWRHERHHRREHEERWEDCGGCGREEHGRHHHKNHHRHHRHDKEGEHDGCGKEDGGCGSKRHRWTLSESKYPFSGGNARIHTMVAKLARAMVQPNDPVADDRLFFTAFAQGWCEKLTPGYAELLRTIDPHSPGKWRVNGPLMNYDKFAEVFSCPVGTPMNPEKKCVIW